MKSIACFICLFCSVILTMAFSVARSSAAQTTVAQSMTAQKSPDDVSGNERSSTEFDRKIAPILAARCLSCHSGKTTEGGLDLSQRKSAMTGGDSGPAFTPGDLQNSVAWQRILDAEMPPEESLDDESKKILKNWILQGAKWGETPIDPFRFSSRLRAGFDWWSLQPLKKVAPPQFTNDKWSRNPVDRFVFERLKQAGIQPSQRANAYSLVRRIYVDLWGILPPPDVVAQFENDPSERAWQTLVDRLLGSPHYGERWARHWLDIARFGESSGFEYNNPRESAWHYRDWLIQALNKDMPFNQFVRMQLAGDVITPDSIEGKAAVGFLIAGVHNQVLGVNPRMQQMGRQEELEEIISTTGQALLGMTIHCARCHDHKFDPISAKEYYQFAAALNGMRRGNIRVRPLRPPNQRVKELVQAHAESNRRLIDGLSKRIANFSQTVNVITSRDRIKANRKNHRFELSLKIAPTVWAAPAQATSQRDGVVIQLVRRDDSILHSWAVSTTPWNQRLKKPGFREVKFGYRGDGSGEIQIRLIPFPIHSGRFGGAIDDLRITDHNGQTIFDDHFDKLEQNAAPGSQAETGKRVFHSGSSPLWIHSGTNTIHSVEHRQSNLALQLFAGNGATPSNLTRKQQDLLKVATKTEAKLARETRGEQPEVFSIISQPAPKTYVLQRGSIDQVGSEVFPGGIKAIKNLDNSFGLTSEASDRQRRLALANWITDQSNPLFHRVAVNRIWHHHFGRGIVGSPSDFGFNGEQPSHPELLEWLSNWFREQDYSLKQLHRLILTSETYRQSSRSLRSPSVQAAQKLDPDNRLLWKHNGRRLDAESYRDSVLLASGQLNRKMNGPGYKDVRVDRVPPAYYYVAIDPIGPEFNRRTIYRWQPRGQRSALLDTLDCPDPSVSTPRRTETTTPSQVLSQWNHPFLLRAADHLAEVVRAEAPSSTVEQTRLAWQRVFGRNPNFEERQLCEMLVREHGLNHLARVLFNSNEFMWVE